MVPCWPPGNREWLSDPRLHRLCPASWEKGREFFLAEKVELNLTQHCSACAAVRSSSHPGRPAQGREENISQHKKLNSSQLSTALPGRPAQRREENMLKLCSLLPSQPAPQQWLTHSAQAGCSEKMTTLIFNLKGQKIMGDPFIIYQNAPLDLQMLILNFVSIIRIFL